MKINVEVDDEQLREAMRLSKSKSKRELVDKALDYYIKMLLRKDLINLRGKITWEGDLDQMRSI